MLFKQVPKILIATCNQQKIIDISYQFLHTISSKFCMCFTLTVHLNSCQLHFKCLVATYGKCLPYWPLQIRQYKCGLCRKEIYLILICEFLCYRSDFQIKVQFHQHHLLKTLSFFNSYPSFISKKLSWHFGVDLFLGSLFYSADHYHTVLITVGT